MEGLIVRMNMDGTLIKREFLNLQMHTPNHVFTMNMMDGIPTPIYQLVIHFILIWHIMIL